MILIDAPNWPGHGRYWSHLVSDTSLAELHSFADGLGISRRAFDRDHYDIPDQRVAACLDAGARLVRSRELVAALRRAGLRQPKRSRLAR